MAAKKAATAKKKSAKKKSVAAAPAPKRVAKKKKNVATKKKRVVPAPRSSASAVYGGMVAEIIDSRSRKSAYKPKLAMKLSVVRRHQPTSIKELTREEREQLTAVFHEQLAAQLANPDNEIEAAQVVDSQGALRYRLYGWNYGVGYLFPPTGLEVVAFGCQHDIEHWSLSQRDVFYAMDEALRKKGHGFEQPLSFCWWDDECWDEIRGAPPGTVGSELNIRKRVSSSLN